MAEEYSQGLEVQDIANKFGASISVVQRAIRSNGVKFRSILTLEQRLDIKQKYENGRTTLSLSKEYGVGLNTVKDCVKKNGGKLNDVGPPKKIKKSNYSDIVSDYISGISAKDIALNLGVADQTVTRVLVEAKVKLRTNSESKRMFEVDEYSFHNITRDSMYWLGFIGADGCINSNSLSVSLKSSDVCHLEKLKTFVNSKHKIYKESSRDAYTFKFASKILCDQLKKYGISERKSLTFSPMDYLLNSRDFWRGMVDGDGWVLVDKLGKPYVGLCGSKDAVEGFVKWAKSVSKTKANARKDGSIYVASIYGNGAIEVLKMLYSNNPKYLLDRKYETAKPFIDAIHSHV